MRFLIASGSEPTCERNIYIPVYNYTCTVFIYYYYISGCASCHKCFHVLNNRFHVLNSCRGGLGLMECFPPCPCCLLGLQDAGRALDLQDASRALDGEDTWAPPLGPTPHTQLTLAALASATVCCDWTSLDDVDVPLHQNPLSLAIDEAFEQRLLSSAPQTPDPGHWLSQLAYPMQVTG